MADESQVTEFPVTASETAVVVPMASPKAPGRPKKGSRPRIDIDDEITEANRLTEVTKKMMKAAKSAQRNSKRVKQRLVRKAGKLSASDLERIATLKRCGLFVPEPTDESQSSSSTAASSSSSTTASDSAPIRRITSKVFSKVGQVEGAADLLASMRHHVPGAMSSERSDVTGGVIESGLAPAMPRVPRGRPLMPARATAFMPSISQGASSAADAPPSSPVGERASSEADHDDDAM